MVVQSDTDSEEDLLKVFELFDEDGKGVISLQSLSRVAKELGENMTTVCAVHNTQHPTPQ